MCSLGKSKIKVILIFGKSRIAFSYSNLISVFFFIYTFLCSFPLHRRISSSPKVFTIFSSLFSSALRAHTGISINFSQTLFSFSRSMLLPSLVFLPSADELSLALVSFSLRCFHFTVSVYHLRLRNWLRRICLAFDHVFNHSLAVLATLLTNYSQPHTSLRSAYVLTI